MFAQGVKEWEVIFFIILVTYVQMYEKIYDWEIYEWAQTSVVLV